MRPWAATIAAALVLASVGRAPVAGGSLSADVDGIRVELTSEPERPGTGGAAAYWLRLSNADGSAVSGAKVTLQGRMADGMTVVAPLRAEPETGIYRGRVLFTMEGRWDLRVRVSGTGKPFELTLTEHVGR